MFITKSRLNYKEYFSPEVNNLLRQISAYSQVYPKQSLADIMHKMLPDAENKLVQKQQFIFHKLNKLKSLLPSETQKEFDILLDSSKKRILKIPYTSEYSAKEFYYQLTGLTKNSDNKKVKKLPVLANMLNHPIFKEEPGPAPAKFLEKFYKDAGINPNLKGNYISPRDTDWRTKLKVLVINEIERIAQGYTTTSADTIMSATSTQINTSAAYIRDYACYYMTSLTDVNLVNATRIGQYAFGNSGLQTLTLNASTVCTLDSINAFEGITLTAIYVPDSLVNSYKTATNWTTYASVIKGISTKA